MSEIPSAAEEQVDSRDHRRYGMYMRFVRLCNEYIANVNDYSIMRNLMAHVRAIQDVSIEKIAQDSSISIPSVSRLVKRLGFGSVREFKSTIESGHRLVMMDHALRWRERFRTTDAEGIARTSYESAVDHLRQTMSQLDMAEIEAIARELRASRTVFLLGDSLELNMFYMLQIMLINSGVPTFAFLNWEVRDTHVLNMGEGDTVLFVSAAGQWLMPAQREFIEHAHEQGCRIIALAQDSIEQEVPVDVIVRYGVPNSRELAYYSIFLLSDIIESVFERDELEGGILPASD